MNQKLYKREGRRFIPINLPIDNTGKYYQEDGTFTDKRTKDSIGLCISSSKNTHTIIALKDAPHLYTHNEAMQIVKIYFNGKGEIPTPDDLLVAFLNFNNILQLQCYAEYRTLISSNNKHWSCVFCFDGYNAVSNIHQARRSWYHKLRPVLKIKSEILLELIYYYMETM